MTVCPACLEAAAGPGYTGLAAHFMDREGSSDPAHVRWLNQNVSRKRLPESALPGALEGTFSLGASGLSDWIERQFIRRFYGPQPHPFVQALQHPSRATLLGYVFEHRHFLRQWVRSCAYIIAHSDRDDVIRYELENLNTEFGGFGTPARPHYELLLRMGESLGRSREEILASSPLPTTRACLGEWDRIARTGPWIATLAAMHSLELIAHRRLVERGASVHYFDPGILEGSTIPDAAKAFLREGYEADVGHSEEALALVDRYATDPATVQLVQATCLRSFDLFDDYLIARLERADLLEG